MARTPPATGYPDGQLGLDLLDPDFGATALHRVTPARLDTWDACPRRYRMLHVDRPAPSRGGAFAHTTLGAVVHLALRALAELPADRRTPAAAAALVGRHWSDEGFADAAQAARYRERAQDWLAAAAEGPAGRNEAVAVERRLSAPVGELLVEGRVDRLDDGAGLGVGDGGAGSDRGAGSDGLTVVDFKTGRRVPSDTDARDSRQLALYAVAAAHVFRRPCRRVELHHVPSGTVAGWVHDDDSLRAHVAAAERTAAAAAGASAALSAGGDPQALFPVRTGTQCGTCPVRRHCPEGRAAVPEPRPWDLLAP
ncbi:PD-(D/E)XK nuclease superfamily protein [Pseudonocardia ammonioxydans]|uniref:PD-(D/E)XK nuclease superfamily protein n=1 Tax=Pseudonocardia ammonioxydans TaxID=260086 RepID=A0A1I4V0Y7_PSUAM|nr:PD-(D/E)XK nuclease family protein [Pseudonocardia ammonioxydans]SFM94846.1 PD-(D/E)XK nuclease superfamily protein [Pseudonocardia ammonioxydans]